MKKVFQIKNLKLASLIGIWAVSKMLLGTVMKFKSIYV